jgi:hypothetical protein
MKINIDHIPELILIVFESNLLNIFKLSDIDGTKLDIDLINDPIINGVIRVRIINILAIVNIYIYI